MAQTGQAEAAQRVEVGNWLGWLKTMGEIPKLEPLCTAIPAGQVLAADDLKLEVRKEADRWASLFQSLADAHGFSLLGVEMAVISDRRRQPLTAPSFFSSYVTMFSAHAEALQRTYQQCIERALGADTPRRIRFRFPIVIHPQLYESTTGYFYASIGRDPHGKSTSRYEGMLQASGYPLSEPDLQAPDRDVASQLGDVAKILGEIRQPESWSELRSSSLVLLPFMRPNFSLPDEVSLDDSGATPGGCVFFLLRDNVDSLDPRLGAFLANARWVLSEASAAESQTAFEAVTRQREFAAAMLHGTVSAIAAIGTSHVIRFLFHGEADQQVLSVDDLIVEFNGDPDIVMTQKQRLVGYLQSMLTAEALASSLTRFAEIHADQGVLREKFLESDDTDLRGLIARSWELALASVRRSGKLVAGEADRAEPGWILPSGYVSSDLLTAIIMELFRNALEHSASAVSEPKIALSVFEKGDAVVIQIANAMSEAQSAPAKTGFLLRTSMLLEHIPGLDLDVRTEQGEYIASLVLGEIFTRSEAANPDESRKIMQSRPLMKGPGR
ncbi:hypothetical protein SAMN05518801_105236 [Novosphingobium sp. CF614]|uniref:hypothetical protein n=1 Tax=Novosphingobium sp. CF614 TaxID=1884364 RepID=UPI0008E68526|nr:hypothetical protein [Novosphingobium sp. CF614]SFG02086.1 hypothetical protein SAMN05518801_105236 [Novosphingobium sp. CF614]